MRPLRNRAWRRILSTAEEKNSTALVALISLLLIAIVAVAAFFIVSANSPEAPVKNVIKAFNTGDSSYLKKAFPDFLLETEYDDENEINEVLEMIKESAEEEFGSGKFKYKVIRKTKLDDGDLDSTRDYAEYLCEINDIATPEITAGYSLRVEIIYDGSYEEDSDVSTINVYKIDGKWCVLGY